MKNCQRSHQFRPTIHEVAKRAGVSAMTVSNVMNGRGRASEATKARVERAITELNYVPSVAARQLAGARAMRIGLIYQAGGTPFLDAVLTGAVKATAARGLQLLLRSGHRLTRREAADLACDLVEADADAILVVSPYAELLSGGERLKSLGVPCCALATGGPLPDMATIRIDNRSAMRELAGRLIALGHRRIGFIAGPAPNGDSAARLEGFRDALAAHGIAFHPELCDKGSFNFASGLAAASRLLDTGEPLSAIMASNDDMAAGVLSEAHRRGLQVPSDLAVTGFDDTSLATRLWPPITVVRQPIDAMASRAVERLLEMLAQSSNEQALRDEIFPHSIVERESTGTTLAGHSVAGEHRS